MHHKKFQTKKDQQKDHAKRRFAERLHIKFSQYLNDLLLNKIYTQQCKLVKRQSHRVSVFEVTFMPRPVDMLDGAPSEITVHLLFDKFRKTIVTVAPPGESFDCEET